MKEINISGKCVRAAVIRSRFTKEQVVASVQDKGLRFSLPGLDKIYRNDLPKNDVKEILEAIAEKCQCHVTDFVEYVSESA